MSARSPLKYQYDGSLDLIGRKTGAYDKRTRSWSALKIAVNACSLGTSEVKPLAPLAHCHAAAMPSWAWNPLKVIAQKKRFQFENWNRFYLVSRACGQSALDRLLIHCVPIEALFRLLRNHHSLW